MLRRNARLRKEYLYRKSLEGKEKAAYERKRLIKKALEGKQHGMAHCRDHGHLPWCMPQPRVCRPKATACVQRRYEHI
jgi:hypothetical protein